MSAASVSESHDRTAEAQLMAIMRGATGGLPLDEAARRIGLDNTRVEAAATRLAGQRVLYVYRPTGPGLKLAPVHVAPVRGAL